MVVAVVPRGKEEGVVGAIEKVAVAVVGVLEGAMLVVKGPRGVATCELWRMGVRDSRDRLRSGMMYILPSSICLATKAEWVQGLLDHRYMPVVCCRGCLKDSVA